MSSVIISGDTSGAITVSAPLVAGTNTLTLQAATATNAVNTLATPVASTSGTAIDFTNLPPWVKKITVMFNNVSTNGASNYLIQIGTSGGIQNTGYIGWASVNAVNAGSTAGFIITAAQAAAALNSGSVILTLLNSSDGTWTSFGSIASTTGVSACSSSGGAKTLSGTLDRVRITSVTPDTFDAGSVNLLYEG
jgi:hypothetical protein